MALRVWLPLNGSLENKGISDFGITPIGTVTYDNNGKIGKSFISGGTSQTTNGINIDSNLLSILGTQCSIAIWVKPLGNHVHYNGTFISSGDWNKQRWAFGVSQDNSKVDVLCGSHNNYISCSVPVNVWTHLVSIFNNGVCTLYKNGEYIGQLTGQAAFVSDASNTCIGRETYAGGYFGFNGRINDVRIYDHALSAKEVKEISQGLILHYKLDNPYMEGTTNLITTEDCLSSTCYNGATNKYGYGTSTDMYKTVGEFNGKKCTKLYMGTNGNSCYPYIYINNMYTSDGSNQPEYKTLSFDYYTTISTSISPYKLGSGNGTATYIVKNSSIKTGTGTNAVVIPVEQNTWNHIEITFHGTTPANAEWGYIQNQPAHTSSTTNYWLFANMQLESKDHATGYAGVGGSRVEGAVKDSSGYENDGIIGGSLSISTDSARYNCSTKFIKGASRIQAINPSFITTGTASIWVKIESIGSSGWLPCTGQSGSYYFLATSAGTGNFYNDNVGSGTIKYYCDGVQVTAPTNLKTGWHHIAITGINLSTWTVMYINSYGGQSATTWNSTCYYSDFRLYNTILSADDVKALYQIPTSIDNLGNLHTFEVEENEDRNISVLKNGIVSAPLPMEYMYLNDGSVWMPVMYHNNKAHTNLFSSSDDFTRFVQHNIDCWADFSLISAVTRPDTSKYEFLAIQQDVNADTFRSYRWSQTNNPITTTSVTGFTVITTGVTHTPAGGLCKCSSNTYLAISNSTNNWWQACGCWTAYQTGIPGFGGISPDGVIALYIRVSKEIYAQFKSWLLLGNQLIEE